ncbi:MAG: serine/threonine-protein phosphatase [Bacteroidales bacterium]|nr:serine/threonine-protein phosphatase [Bacteroidales bacterium]
MFHNLRLQILLWFLGVTILAALFILVNSYFINKKNDLSRICHELQDTQIMILQDINVQKDFFTYDLINPLFYKTGTSEILFEHHTISSAIKQKIGQISQMQSVETFNMDSILYAVTNDILKYNSKLDTVVNLIKKRGYKTSGLEGQLLGTMKKIENSGLVPKEILYKIDFFEKEYFIRGEKIYVDSLNLLIIQITKQIKAKNTSNSSYIIPLLNSYKTTFNQLTYLDEKLGLKHKEGLREELDQLAQEIGVNFSLLVDSADVYEHKLTKQLILTYILVGLFLLTISISISFIVSKRISKPIVYLSSQINAFVASKFTLIEKIHTSNPKGEIGQLGHNFIILRDEIFDYLNYFKEKVDERTAELLIEKNKVENQKEEIETQRDALNCQNLLISAQKKEVEKQKDNVLSSIRYASRIQHALLADEQQLRNLIPNSFLFQKPRDIVSGDFCFVERIKTRSGDFSVVILADCTGHGVPGAFMSLLCYSYLNQIIKINQHINPIYILATLNNMIYSNFHKKQNDTKISDGMDISYLLINNQTLNCEYAGAHNPLYLFRNNELIVFKGDRISIGDKNNIIRKITKHTFRLEPNDTIFLFTDGYVDQSGGVNLEKYKFKRFRELLMKIHQQDVDLQKKELEQALIDWKGDKDQIDDITVLGFKVEN